MHLSPYLACIVTSLTLDVFQPDGEDDLKKRQLMELAIINGTYRDTTKPPSSLPQTASSSRKCRLTVSVSPPGRFGVPCLAAASFPVWVFLCWLFTSFLSLLLSFGMWSLRSVGARTFCFFVLIALLLPVPFLIVCFMVFLFEFFWNFFLLLFF